MRRHYPLPLSSVPLRSQVFGSLRENLSQVGTEVSVTRDILLQLRVGTIELDELHWRTLEEVVAELLRAKGMQVSVTSESSDGGRDVIARGGADTR